MMKRIIVNGRFLLHRVTGVERYAREILAELDKIIGPDEIEMAVPPEVEELPDYRNIKVVRTGKLHNRLWEQVSFPAYVREQKGISLNLCNVAPLLAPGIAGILDVKIKARPQDFSRKFLIWYNLLFSNACRRAKRIITLSEFSRKEIIKYYNVDPDRIAVIPCAWQHYQRVGFDEGALEKYGLEKGKYYFSICSLEPNKNLRWIADAARQKPEWIFAVAGSVNRVVFAEGLGFQCPGNMKLLGYVRDEEAKTLMRNCRAFLFPTFYEGFGIPPLEALSAGAASVVVSDTEVMHELFEDQANYIDPNKYETIIENEAIDRRAEILKKYSWEESAKELALLLKTVN